jgi:hypothetical protein
LHWNPVEQVGDWLSFNLPCCCCHCPKSPNGWLEIRISRYRNQGLSYGTHNAVQSLLFEEMLALVFRQLPPTGQLDL